MPIQVFINDARITQEGIALAITSTNTAIAGRTVNYGKTYPTTLTAQQIKTQIETDLTLLWIALATPSWTI